jgi:8-oxo-dGTP diphosphatase
LLWTIRRITIRRITIRRIELQPAEPLSYVHDLRSRIGPRRIILVFSSVILRDRQGRVLMQKRTDLKVWGLPGGVLELGEDILACARRELQEETGLSAGPLSLVGVYSEPELDVRYPNGDQVQQFTICLAGEATGGQMRVDGVETSRQRFFDPGRLPWSHLPAWYTRMLQDALCGNVPAFGAPQSMPQLTSQYEELRSILGHDPLILAGAIGVTVRADGKILMVLRRDVQTWTFPGGFSDLGENAAHTAQRETQEETGLETIPRRLMGVYTPRETYIYPNQDQVQTVAAIFQMRPAGGELRKTGAETLDAAWMAPDAILKLPAHPFIQPLHQAVIDHLLEGSFIIPSK